MWVAKGVTHCNMATNDYNIKGRAIHCTVRVGNYLYMWGGYLEDSSNDKEQTCVEIFDLLTGKWEQKVTTGNPPLGIMGYCATAVENEIYYFGGRDDDNNYYNSIHGLNVESLLWREVSPTVSTTTSGHPLKKAYSGMIAVQFNGESYLVIFGGNGPSINNTPHQSDAQYDYSFSGTYFTNEIHYYQLSTGQWMSPIVTGKRPPPCSQFTLTSITNDSAILFGGVVKILMCSQLYTLSFTLSSVTFREISKNESSIEVWPKGRSSHSSVLIDDSYFSTVDSPHLLVVGGSPNQDSWLFDIEKEKWKELDLPERFIDKWSHSLSVWSVTPTTVWLIEFGGYRRGTLINDTEVLELIYSDDQWSNSIVPLDWYTQKLRERKRKRKLSTN